MKRIAGLPGGETRIESRAPGVASPEIDLMKGFHEGVRAKVSQKRPDPINGSLDLNFSLNPTKSHLHWAFPAIALAQLCISV